jgi:formylglycine-generating enzyme required for sulfatase activity
MQHRYSGFSPEGDAKVGPAQQPALPENFVVIRGGCFIMGSQESEEGRSENENPHEVRLSDFTMCRYAVTVGEYLGFVEETASHYPEWLGEGSAFHLSTGSDDHYTSFGEALTGAGYPVVGVSWEDAVAYCRWLSEKRGGIYRLPTEAEWEYACRAGTSTPFSTGVNLTTEEANYNGEYPFPHFPTGANRGRTVPVGTFQPNAFGLYAMHGNVREWCGDWYDVRYYGTCRAKGVVENPRGPRFGSLRVLRGGGWNYHAVSCRSACRFFDTPGYRNNYTGFRVVFIPAQA